MGGVGFVTLISTVLLTGFIEPAKQDLTFNSACGWNMLHSLNCSFIGISALPNINVTFWHDSINHIDLSHNQISELYLKTFSPFSALETINLNNNHIYSFSLDIYYWVDKQHVNSIPSEFLKYLHTLLLERNRLKAIPKGLGKLRSLQTLSLSVNTIVHIQQDDFKTCTKLEWLNLQYNHISKIHPDAFSDTRNLKVLKLRGNMLITIAPVVFMHTHMLQADVELLHNPWTCDCKIPPLKQFISFLLNDVGKEWNITCATPPSMAGTHLLSTGDFHSTCTMPLEDEFNFKSVIIPTGIKTVLQCDLPGTLGNQGTFWWTPQGAIFEHNKSLELLSRLKGNQGTFWWTPQGAIFEHNKHSNYYMDHMKNLVATVSSHSEEGLFICVSNDLRIVYQVYVQQDNSPILHRGPRDVQGRSTLRTQEDFTLAVCLSVIISFLSAFCLGVFTRPFIEKLWRKHCKSKRKKENVAYTTNENKGFTDENLEMNDSTRKTVNNFNHVHPQYTVQNELHSGIYTHTYNNPEQHGASEVYETTIHRNHNPIYENVTDGQSITHSKQNTIHVPISTSNKNIMQCEKDNKAIQREGEDKAKGNAAKNKYVTGMETDGMTHGNVCTRIKADAPSLFPDSSAFINNPDFTTAEIIKSPRNKQLFIASESKSLTEEKQTNINIVNTSGTTNATFIHSGNPISIKKGHLDNCNRENCRDAFCDSDNSSDDGSFFSFSMSNSASDTDEAMGKLNINDDDNEKIDHIIKDTTTESSLSGGDLQANPQNKYSFNEHGSNTAGDTSPSSISKQSSTSSSASKTTIHVIDYVADRIRLGKPSSQEDTDSLDSEDIELSESEHSDESVRQSNDPVQYLQDEQHFLQAKKFQDNSVDNPNSNNISTFHISPSTIQPDNLKQHNERNSNQWISTLDKNIYGSNVTANLEVVQKQHHYESSTEYTSGGMNTYDDTTTIEGSNSDRSSLNSVSEENDLQVSSFRLGASDRGTTYADSDVCKKEETMPHFLQGSKDENVSSELKFRTNAGSIVSNYTHPVKEISFNLETHERNVKSIDDIYPESQYNTPHNEPLDVLARLTTNLSWEIPDFRETNINVATIDLDLSSGELQNFPHFSMTEGVSVISDKVTPGTTEGFFIKKKRVFDGFSASLKSGQT